MYIVYMDLVEEVGESSSPPRSYGSFGGGGGSGGGHDVIRNDVYNRLMDNGNEEAIGNPEFREQLEGHFNRLPQRYLCGFIFDEFGVCLMFYFVKIVLGLFRMHAFCRRISWKPFSFFPRRNPFFLVEET